MSRRLLLGIDGGGTSTSAWLADLEGNVLGRGFAGPSNVRAVGAEASRQALQGSIDRAFAGSGVPPQPVDIACLGLAGFDRLEEKQLVEGWSNASGWSHRLVLVNDGDLVVAAGTAEGWGVGLIAGTGSIAVGRARDGRTARAGGWGYLFGDEGSGYAVALAGLRKVARRADGRERTDGQLGDRLTSLILDSLGIGDANGLIPAIYRAEFDRARIAGLAPLVLDAAREDRSIVEEILEPAGRELAEMVLAVAATLEISPGRLPLAMAGGFLIHSPDVVRIVHVRLAEGGYEPEGSMVAEPVQGAIVLARRAWNRG